MAEREDPPRSDQELRSKAQAEMAEEAEHFTGGPGVIATKSQARGGLGGTVLGAVIGAVLGLVAGALFFEGTPGVVISVVAFAAGGGTCGAIVGAFVRPRQKLEGSETEADT